MPISKESLVSHENSATEINANTINKNIIQHSVGVRVRYAETDAMGVAHHANYPVWFEMGRSEMMRARGFSYRELEAAGYYMMLTDLQVSYRRAARYDDELIVHTTLLEVRSRALKFGYELWRGSELIATGSTAHITTNHAYQPVRLPTILTTLLY